MGHWDLSDAGQCRCQCNNDELSLTRRVEYVSLRMNNLLLLKNPKKFNRLKVNFLYRADMRPQCNY